MSSRILTSDDTRAISPVVWRQVGGAIEGDPAASPAVDEAALAAQKERQWEQRVQEARAAGYREGEAAARSRCAAEMQAITERMSRAIQEMAGLRAGYRRQAEGDMVRLALAIARRIVRRELTIDPDVLRGLVLAALEKLEGQEIARVKVHPSQAAAVSACLKEAGGYPVEVFPDPARDPGAVFFEMSHGNLDASVDTQLQEIERGLLDRLRKQS